MKFHLDQTEGIYLVNAYDGDGVVINRQRHGSSLILSPERLTESWPISAASEFDAAH